ncbi:MarR family transcriptional regulator [Streptomyces sp. JAC25]|uniref:MarR family transcriptional regulator n=1 Tax=unclassified Streptomyces TaxID=2593676 RepID=UPI002273CB04|nr:MULTISPECIES: MarR family transcriptional regulator [unclassified Streptomyces]MCY1654150.1 MarR family transcriptional regulator [Streptomyces sp. SL203]MCY1678572.1 MarR family transcriptional regulator [Streptomyces sp. SL294]
MAIQHLSSAPLAPAASRPYRKAHTGYGKQTVPAQGPSGAGAFASLPERERYVAGYLDHLPDGAAMDIKSLAKDLPLYGQMAIGTALRALAVAGHLRRVRCRVEGDGRCRWVTLTYWSRTAHDNEWWTAMLAGEAATGPEQAPVRSAEPILPGQRGAQADITMRTSPNPPRDEPNAAGPTAVAAPSPACLVLAELGRREPRLALSAADCAALEPLAAAWFARGVSADYLTSALTAGLPERIGSPVGLVRRRLTDKMPPHLPAAPAPTRGLPPGTPVRGLLVECTDCGRPGPAAALPDGLCKPCRTAHRKPESSEDAAPGEVERDVPALVASLRNLMRTP